MLFPQNVSSIQQLLHMLRGKFINNVESVAILNRNVCIMHLQADMQNMSETERPQTYWKAEEKSACKRIIFQHGTYVHSSGPAPAGEHMIGYSTA